MLTAWTLAQPQDLSAVAALWRSAWMSANPDATTVDPLPHWEHRASQEFGPPSTCILLRQGAALVAFFVFDMAQRYLHQLFVAPTCQGQGLGALVLSSLDQSCPGGWSLHVAQGNHGAQRFYERHGLLPGARSCHPVSGRVRIQYDRIPAPAVPVRASRMV